MPIPADNMTPLIMVFDMPTSLAFYRDTLGFEIINTSGPGDDFGWCLMRLGGAQLMLNTAYDKGERPATPDATRIAAHDDTILYFACPDPDAAYQYLRTQGMAATAPTDSWYGMRQVQLKDPDGYLLCFQCPAQ